jgi:hypothetical protein
VEPALTPITEVFRFSFSLRSKLHPKAFPRAFVKSPAARTWTEM